MRFILGFNEHYIVNVKIQNRTVFGFSFLCMCVMFIQENVTSWRETWIYICFERKKKLCLLSSEQHCMTLWCTTRGRTESHGL